MHKTEVSGHIHVSMWLVPMRGSQFKVSHNKFATLENFLVIFLFPPSYNEIISSAPLRECAQKSFRIYSTLCKHIMNFLFNGG